MKKLTIIFLLFAALIGSGNRVANKSAGGGGYPGITYAIHQGFESGMTGEWGAKFDPSTILNTADSSAANPTNGGVNGMSIASGSAAEAYQPWRPASFGSGRTLVLSYTTGTYGNFDGNSRVVTIVDDSVGNQMILWEGDDASSGSRTFSWSLDGDTGGTDVLANNTRYTIMIDYVPNGTTTVRFYNTSNVQVGSELSATAPNVAVDEVHFGGYGVISSTTRKFDEIYISATAVGLPYGPPQ